MLKITKLWMDGDELTTAVRSRITGAAAPLFGWTVLSDADGDAQSACRVTLADGETLLWDSGWLPQTEQRLTYAGAPMPVGRALTLTAAVRSTSGQEAVSEPVTIYNGLRPEWEGKWLQPAEYKMRAVTDYRKVFTVDAVPADACLYLAGIGYHKAYLNGNPVDTAVMDPAHANYAKTVYYTVLPDVAALLKTGENVLTVQVADGWRSNDSDLINRMLGERKVEFEGHPTLSAVLEWKDAAGVHRIVTDESWQWKHDAVIMANIFDGETYDANAADPAWLTAGGEGWSAVMLGEGPGGEMLPMTIPPVLEQETYPAIDVFEAKKGVFVADFGQNIAGVLRFSLPAGLEKGRKITVRFMEILDEDGTLYTAPLRDAKQTDTYIASGDERDLAVWQARFTYHGFRYAEIHGLPAVEREQLTAVALYTDVAGHSSFRCGNALINQIHKNAVQTEKSNIHSILTDCPQRDERMGWMNDATVRFEETPYNFRIGRLFAKVVKDIRNEQRENGAFTCCAPFVFGALPADPVCSSYLVAGAQALLHTGNLGLIAEAFDGYAAWEDFLLSQSVDGIVQYSHYGDWAGPEYACEDKEVARSKATPGILMSTGYSYFNCRTLAKFAEMLGREEDAATYARLAQDVREAFLKKWWDPITGKVAEGSQGAQSFALWLDILPEEGRQIAANVLHIDLVTGNYKITTGNLCTRYMMEVLTRYGYLEDAWKLLNSTEYPSYGYMINNEATTVWERFELKKNPGMNSHNHPMYGAVDCWFYAWLCGIKPTSSGFDTVDICPYYPADLLSAQAVVDTVHGDVGVRWTKRFGEYHLYVHLPFGVTGTVHTPEGSVTVGSGSHQFHWPWEGPDASYK